MLLISHFTTAIFTHIKNFLWTLKGGIPINCLKFSKREEPRSKGEQRNKIATKRDIPEKPMPKNKYVPM